MVFVDQLKTGRFIAEMRTSMGMTQRELAEKRVSPTLETMMEQRKTYQAGSGEPLPLILHSSRLQRQHRVDDPGALVLGQVGGAG